MVSDSLAQLGMTELERDNYAKAQRFLDQCLQIERKLKNQSKIAITVEILGFLAEKQCKLDLAEKLYQDAYKTFEKLGEKSNLEIVSKNLERVRGRMSNH